MPASAVYAATDPCEYGAVIRGADVNVLISRRGSFRAKVTRIDLHKMWLQRGQENLPRIFRSTPPENRVVVSFVTEESSPVIRLGSEVSPQQIIIMSPGRLSTWRSLGAARWCAMSLPTEDFLFWGRALTGRDVMPQELQQIITPSLLVMSRLQELHRLAGHLAETAPGVIAATEAASGLEQSLIEAMFACIGTEAVHDLATARRHGEIMRRFEAVLESNLDKRLYLPEICAAIGVPGRTLRACCAEFLGMGPKQYLHLRLMHLAHRALLQADPDSVTVTEIATRFGFWELGRFAVAYRSLFKELPSATLKRPLIGGSVRNNSSLSTRFAKFA